MIRSQKSVKLQSMAQMIGQQALRNMLNFCELLHTYITARIFRIETYLYHLEIREEIQSLMLTTILAAALMQDKLQRRRLLKNFSFNNNDLCKYF